MVNYHRRKVLWTRWKDGCSGSNNALVQPTKKNTGCCDQRPDQKQPRRTKVYFDLQFKKLEPFMTGKAWQ